MMWNSEQCLDEAVAEGAKAPTISLCDLPMDILSTILSLLPINDAIRTSVLLRKLKYVWCSHANLNFDKVTMRKTYFKPSTGYYIAIRDKEFVTKVNTVLRQHSGVRVEHMEIKFELHGKHADHINKWVNFAISSRTKGLVINLSGHQAKFGLARWFSYRPKQRDREGPYNLLSQLFSPNNGSYLRCLELWTASLQLPSDFKGFLNLKRLTLVDVSITDEDVQCMLSKCNLLEFLEIAYCIMVTSIRMLRPLDQLKHLVVDRCPKLKEIELNCSPTTLKYSGGTLVPLIFASTFRLTHVSASLWTPQTALAYIVTGFPSTLPRLETLTLRCHELEDGIRKPDVLDYACLLKIAPFLETLVLHMWMNYWDRPYCRDRGELRVGLPHQHAHLKSVRISGFIGYKEQVELALHILRSSIELEKMEITPKPDLEVARDYRDIARMVIESPLNLFAEQTIATLLVS